MKPLYTRFAAAVLFPLHELLKRHATVRLRKSLERSQWNRVEELQAQQLVQLNALLADVRDHVPYWRELFSTRPDMPRQLGSLGELKKLPLLTKDVIRANTDKLRSASAQGLSRFNTGGSSGEPLIFYIGKRRVSHDVAAKWRATRWWGVDIGDREIVLWGSPIELGAQDGIKALRDRVFRTRLLPAFAMSDAKVDGFIKAIRDFRPRMLFGYPSALSYIAQHARNRGVRLDDLGIKVAFVTSERLYDEQRLVIEQTFGCPVANGYGGRDAGFIAHQCPHGSMHITAEDVIVELLDADGREVPDGTAGEIVVTHLATRDFPFIRYRTGDIAVRQKQPCACGRGLPSLQEIQGRSTDFVVAQDGTVMHGLSLIYVLRDTPGVAAFKIVQETLEVTRVQIVAGPTFLPQSIEDIQRGLRRRLGEGVRIEVECVDAIPAERSGKYRYVISHVNPHQGVA